MNYETNGRRFPKSAQADGGGTKQKQHSADVAAPGESVVRESLEIDSGSVTVPGRVNLIGEHIDYYGLPVLPMAIQQHVALRYTKLSGRTVRASSPGFHNIEFDLADTAPFPAGDWGNYLKAAVVMLGDRWQLAHGLQATVSSDLPLAAGLSSSSALVTAFALALLRVNSISPTLRELMELLPDGEQYVGTRGGGMDHAAVLASQAGCALLIHFVPLAFEHIPIPDDWTFLVAHSLTLAEKSGAAKVEYNQRRAAGMRALELLGLDSFHQTLDHAEPERLATSLPTAERDTFWHAVSEAKRVQAAVEALREGDAERFGRILVASHESLRDQLRVSNPSLDRLVECALGSGALGARLTGAGFGGCALVLCKSGDRDRVRSGLIERFYRARPDFDPAHHLLIAKPSAGALAV